MDEKELEKLILKIRQQSTELYGHLVAIIEEIAKQCQKLK